MARSPLPMPKGKLMGVVAVLTFGLTSMFAVLPLLDALVAPTFVLGFFVVLPLVGILGEELGVVESDESSADASEAPEAPTIPVERLRERYARGEITESEFEARLERLLETEDLDRRVDDRERSLELE